MFITQLVYVHPGKESVFGEFEAVAIPLIGKYGGELPLRRRLPTASSPQSVDMPCEIHQVRFQNDEALASFAAEGERLLHRLTEGAYHRGPMVRVLALTYGAVCYLAFLAVFGVLLGFLANVDLVRAIDGGPIEALPVALAIDVGLVAFFGVLHSVMARPWFKLVWVRLVPRAAERSTYVLVASLTLALLAWQWRAIAVTVWDVAPPIARVALSGISCAGIVLLVVSTFLTDHLDLFGVRQVWLYASGRPYSPVPFREQRLYRYVRHPMMIGFLLWFWATPTMSVGRLVFVLAMTLYVFIGVALEERDLAQHLGEPYRAYRERVGAFIPRLRG